MPNYIYPNDGKLHTRYSELARCTPGQIDYLIGEREGELDPFVSAHTIFGEHRHEIWASQSLESGLIPHCFRELQITHGIALDHVEKEFATELVRGAVVHSLPDAVSIESKTIFDYKTTLDGVNGWKKNVQSYKYSKQTLFYALQLQLHGIEINRAVYLCEVWDGNREHILGYHAVEREITPEKLAEVKEWAVERIVVLRAALKQLAQAKEQMAA